MYAYHDSHSTVMMTESRAYASVVILVFQE